MAIAFALFAVVSPNITKADDVNDNSSNMENRREFRLCKKNLKDEKKLLKHADKDAHKEYRKSVATIGETYRGKVKQLAATKKTAIEKAKTDFRTAMESATTASEKLAAKEARKNAMKLAEDTFKAGVKANNLAKATDLKKAKEAHDALKAKNKEQLLKCQKEYKQSDDTGDDEDDIDDDSNS